MRCGAARCARCASLRGASARARAARRTLRGEALGLAGHAGRGAPLRPAAARSRRGAVADRRGYAPRARGAALRPSLRRCSARAAQTLAHA